MPYSGLTSAAPDRRVHVGATWWDGAAALLVISLGLINAVLLPRSLEAVLSDGPAVDWRQFVEGGDRVFGGDLYTKSGSYGFRYSPIVAYVFALIGPIGTTAWRLLHMAAALALPTWPMRLVTLASWPFWFDVETGNVMVFVLLTAAWAIRGSRVGAFGFVLLTLFFPRPLMLPIAAWILWKRPEWRVPIAAITLVHAVAVLATGWADEWIALLLLLGDESAGPNNLGPTRVFGAAWLIVGIPLAAFLTWRGRLGWASLAISYPYVLPYYLVMLVLEVPNRLRPATQMRPQQT